MYHTLQDFTAHAKGVSYLIAALFLSAFIVFWFFLTKKVTRKKK